MNENNDMQVSSALVSQPPTPPKEPWELDDRKFKDHAFKVFCRDPATFLDLFNYFVFEGEQVLTPDKVQLEDRDPNTVFLKNSENGELVSLEKLRDLYNEAVLKEDVLTGVKYLFLGVEAQSTVDHDMPLRVMLYDALAYQNQIRHGTAKHDGEQTGSDEPVAPKRATAPQKRLTPVITLVVYTGKRAWTGPRSLYDMMPPLDDRLQRVIPNHKINLIEPLRMKPDEFQRFHTEWRGIFEAFQKYVMEGSESLFKHLTSPENALQYAGETTRNMLEALTGTLLPKPDEKRSKSMEMAQDIIDYLEARDRKTAEALRADITAEVTADITKRVTADVTERVTADVTERVTADVTAAAKVERDAAVAATAIAAAKRMLLNGIGLDLVAKCVDLPYDQVKALSEQINA